MRNLYIWLCKTSFNLCVRVVSPVSYCVISHSIVLSVMWKDMKDISQKCTFHSVSSLFVFFLCILYTTMIYCYWVTYIRQQLNILSSELMLEAGKMDKCKDSSEFDKSQIVMAGSDRKVPVFTVHRSLLPIWQQRLNNTINQVVIMLCLIYGIYVFHLNLKWRLENDAPSGVFCIISCHFLIGNFADTGNSRSWMPLAAKASNWQQAHMSHGAILDHYSAQFF